MSALLSRRPARALLTVVLAASLAISLCSCIAIQKAAQVIVQVTADKIVLVKPTGGDLSSGGETVITIQNFTDAKRQLVLAEGDLTANDLPAEVLDAITPREDSRIVAITAQMGKVRIQVALGVPQPNPTVAKMHVHLKPGHSYLLFDRLGGYAHGVALELTAPR